eukprot:gene24479-26288_t
MRPGTEAEYRMRETLSAVSGRITQIARRGANAAPPFLRSHVLKLIVTRALLGVVTLFAVSVLIFVCTQILPGDVASAVLGQSATPETLAAFRKELGLDQPAYWRFYTWL